MNKKEKIAAVVPTYNRKELLEECLIALLKQTYKLDSIIIIDDNSDDGTKEMLEKKFLNNKIFDYVRLNKNAGATNGFAYGIKRAYEKGFDWIWLINDDSTPLPDSLQNIMDSHLIRDENVLALCCTVLHPDGDIMLHHRKKFNYNKLSESNIPTNMYNLPYFEIDTGTFVGFLLKRDAVDKVGVLKKELFIYYEDTEYCLRIRKIGCKIYNISNSKIVHNISTAASKWTKMADKPTLINRIRLRFFAPFSWRDYYMIRNGIYVYSQLLDSKISYVWFYIKFVRNLFIDTIRILFNKKRMKWIFILFRANLDGIRGRLGKFHSLH